MRLFIINSTGWGSLTSTPVKLLCISELCRYFGLGHFKIFKKTKQMTSNELANIKDNLQLPTVCRIQSSMISVFFTKRLWMGLYFLRQSCQIQTFYVSKKSIWVLFCFWADWKWMFCIFDMSLSWILWCTPWVVLHKSHRLFFFLVEPVQMQLYRVEPIGASLQAADVANADSVVLNAVYIHWRGQGQVFLAVISRKYFL